MFAVSISGQNLHLYLKRKGSIHTIVGLTEIWATASTGNQQIVHRG